MCGLPMRPFVIFLGALIFLCFIVVCVIVYKANHPSIMVKDKTGKIVATGVTAPAQPKDSADEAAGISLLVGFLLEDTLRRIELGTLPIPEGTDIATFLLSDGNLAQKPRN